jgi:hypothetical protein
MVVEVLFIFHVDHLKAFDEGGNLQTPLWQNKHKHKALSITPQSVTSGSV